MNIIKDNFKFKFGLSNRSGIQLDAGSTVIAPSSMGDAWADRVVANGGVRPSQAIINAANTFASSLDSAQILSKMLAINFFAPSNLIASLTPFIIGPGFDPWINSNFVSGDLSVNGLKGTAASQKSLDTGLIPNTLWSTTSHGGASMYLQSNTGGMDACEMGVMSVQNSGDQFHFYGDFQGTTYGDWCYLGSAGLGGRLQAANNAWNGFLALTRVSDSDYRIYKAKSTQAHIMIASTGLSAGGGNATAKIRVFCRAEANSLYSFTDRALSYVSFNDGLTAGESASEYAAVQTLRIAFGGGYT